MRVYSLTLLVLATAWPSDHGGLIELIEEKGPNYSDILVAKLMGQKFLPIKEARVKGHAR